MAGDRRHLGLPIGSRGPSIAAPYKGPPPHHPTKGAIKGRNPMLRNRARRASSCFAPVKPLGRGLRGGVRLGSEEDRLFEDRRGSVSGSVTSELIGATTICTS